VCIIIAQNAGGKRHFPEFKKINNQCTIDFHSLAGIARVSTALEDSSKSGSVPEVCSSVYLEIIIKKIKKHFY